MYLSEIRQLGGAGTDVWGCLQYPSVDDHDVRKFGGETQLHLHAAVKLKYTTLWQSCHTKKDSISAVSVLLFEVFQ